MVLHGHDGREKASVPAEQVPVGAPPPVDAPPPPPPAGPDVATATTTPPATPPRPGRRSRRAWLVGGIVACLVIIAALLGVRSWDLDGQVADLTEENQTLTEENETLTADNVSLDAEVTELTAEIDSIRALFPLTYESLAGADLAGNYEFLFVPVEGECTYSDCDQIGPERYPLSISRTSDGYALALEGVAGTPAPMSRDGDVYTSSGVLPESMWGTCGDTPAETSFELHLAVAAVGLSGGDLRAVEAGGTYRQYTPANLDCGPSESSSTFTARRTG